MALIKCSECEKEVSEKAKVCPNCGNPIAPEVIKVYFQTPQGSVVAKWKSTLSDENGNILWEGKMGETAIIESKEPITLIAQQKKGFFGKPSILAKPGDMLIVAPNAFGKLQFLRSDKDFANRENNGVFGSWGSLFK